MRISTIIDKINEFQLHVPIFQREYVWKRSDVKRLIESLIHEYPTWTMLTWETANPPMIKGTHQYRPEQWAIKLILDGQQRITSLYMIITGEIPPYYTKEEIINDTRRLYVNLETLELEYFMKNKMSSNPLWVNLTDLLQKRIKSWDIVKELESKQEVTRDLQNTIHENYIKIERILDKEFLEQIIPSKATVKEAIDIFYIVNASGVSLTDAELALAQISWYRPEARDLFKTKLDELEKSWFVFKLDFIVYVMLWVLHFNWAEMEKLHKQDNLEEMKKARWLLDKKVLDYVCNILKSHAFIDHTKEINSIYALVPIIVYVFHKAWQKLTQEEISKVVKRFYYSQIRVRYISQLPQKLNKDLTIIKNSHSPFDDLLWVIKDERSLTIDENEFIWVGVLHPLFWLMKWFFKSKWAVCLSTGLTLRKNMGKKYSLERDHIFAYSILKNNGYDINNRHKYGLAQEITNRAILTQEWNRTKSNMDAEIYLKQVSEQLPSSLKLQCIPEDKELWKLENFELFLKKRRQILAEQLNQFLEWLTKTNESTLQVSIEDLIEEWESKYMEFKSSLRRDTKEWIVNKLLEYVILKVISSFSNAEWGTLLIGVNDDGKVLGLQNDYDSLWGDRDEFELHLTNIISRTFGADFKSTNIEITFPIVHEHEICMIQIKQWDRPLYIEEIDKNWQKKEKFFARSGNSSWEFSSLEEMNNYIKKRF